MIWRVENKLKDIQYFNFNFQKYLDFLKSFMQLNIAYFDDSFYIVLDMKI